jgi:hypothetical protein
MSASPPTGWGNWGYLGGFFGMFIGWFAGFVGCITVADSVSYADPEAARLSGLTQVGVGVLMVAAGIQVMARVGPMRLFGDPGTIVLVLLTPIPAVIGFAMNQVGQVFRQSEAFALRVVLLAVGASLVGMSVMWVAGGAIDAGRDDFQSFLWALALQFGVGVGGLGLAPPTKVEEPVELVEVG